jgi:hypothetical protein
MSGAIPLFLQLVFMASCSVKAQGQLYLCLYILWPYQYRVACINCEIPFTRIMAILCRVIDPKRF